MKRIFLLFAFLLAAGVSFAQEIQSPLDEDDKQAFVESHLYRMPEFSRGTVIFSDKTIGQGVININNIHQCTMMINGNDTIPLMRENDVEKIVVGAKSFIKIKGLYLEVVEYGSGEVMLALLTTLRAIDMGKSVAYGGVSGTSSVTSVGTITGAVPSSIERLRPDLNLNYIYEQSPVFVKGDSIYFVEERQLCRLFKKKSDAVKSHFAAGSISRYDMAQAQEMFRLYAE